MHCVRKLVKMNIFPVIIAILFPHLIVARVNKNTVQFVKDYFTFKKARIVTTFTCSKYDSFLLEKTLNSAGRFWLVSADPDQPVGETIESVIMRTYNTFGIFVDYDCPAGKNYLFENSEHLSLNSSFYWLVWSEQKYSAEEESLNLHIDTDMTWAFPDQDRIILHDLYKINYSWPINGTEAGYWSSGTGVRYTLEQYKYSRRQDMRGIVFKAGLAVNNIPTDNLHEELVKKENRKMDAMATYNYKVFKLLEQFYNFSVDIHDTKLYGYVVENGREEGLTLMLKNQEVQFSISAIQTNRARYRCTDFVSVPTWEFRLVALFRHPPVTGYYGQVLLTPFEMNVWTSCLGMWVVVILTIRFVSWVETSTFDFVATSNEEETVRSWSDSLMIIIGAISEQGTTMDSKWVAWRIAFLAAFILSMMVNINYSASLVSSLLSTPTKTIKTTRDLIDSSLTFGAEEISYSIPYFALNSDPLVHELYQKKMAPQKQAYFPRDVALVKMRKEYFAFHTEALKVFSEVEDMFTDKEKCDLTEVLVFAPEKCYLPIPWGSPHKEAVSFAMRKIYETGLINYQDRIWRIPKPPCTIKEEFVSVDMDKISPSFVIVGVGIIVAFVVLAGEMASKRRMGGIKLFKKQSLPQSKERISLGKEDEMFRENFNYFQQRGFIFD